MKASARSSVVHRGASIALLTASLVAFAGAPRAFASHTASAIEDFEVDGNSVDQSPGSPPYDWDTIPGAVEIEDPYGSMPDTIFVNSKEFVPGSWTFVADGSAPSKDDIVQARLAQRQIGSEHWLFLSAQRAGDNGDAFINFENNRSKETIVTSTGSVVPKRTAGDSMIAIFVTHGGSTRSIKVYKWQGDAFTGSWVEPPSAPVNGVDYSVAVNNTGNNRFDFIEAAINLEDFNLAPSCPGGGRTWVKTTSSSQFSTAALKDRTERIAMDLSDCARISISKIDDAEPAQPVADAVFDLRKDDGDSVFEPNDDVLQTTCTTSGSGTCTFEEVPAGTYFIIESSAPSGYVADPAPKGPFTVAPKEHLVVPTAFVNHKLEPNFTIAKSAAPTSATVGGTVDYQILVDNTGDGPGSVTVTDDYDEDHVTLGDISHGGVASGGIITWTLSDVAPASSVALTYQGVFTGPFSGPPNAGCANGGFLVENDAALSNGATSGADVCVVAKPDLDVTKGVDKPAASPSEELTYTLSVVNNGDADATNVVVVDTLPQRTSFVSASPGCTESAGTVTCDAGTLAVGASASFSITVSLDSVFPDGSTPVENKAAADSDQTDPENSNTVTTTVTADTVLALQKDGPATATAGTDITYSLTITNQGNADATGVVIVDPVPAGTTFVSSVGCQAASGVVTCQVGSLDAGQSASVSITVHIDSSTTGTITNSASATDGQGGSDEDTVQTIVETLADLAIDKQAPESVVAGTEMTYTLVVTNAGPSDATGVVITDPVPAGTVFVSASSGCVEVEALVTCSLGTIANGGSSTVTITVTVLSSRVDDIINAATTSSDVSDPNPGNNQDSVTTDVIVRTDVSIVKAVDKTEASAADTLTYTVTVANGGPSDSTEVVVTDAVPTGATFASCAPIAACSESAGTVTWTLPVVAAGTSLDLSLVVTLDAAFPSGITFVKNTASATSGQDPDPVGSNEVVTTVTELSKVACPSTDVPPGGAVTYTIEFGVYGGDATGIVVTDTLPEQFRYSTASASPASEPGSGETGTVVWSIGSMSDGDTKALTIDGFLSTDVTHGEVVENEAEIKADGVPAVQTTQTIVVSTEGNAQSGRAFGISATLAETQVVGPTPDSDQDNPGQVLTTNGIVPTEVARADVLTVAEDGAVEGAGSTAEATTDTTKVRVLDLLPGPASTWLVSADAVHVVSSSTADTGAASSSMDGSFLTDVAVNGTSLGSVTEPQEIIVPLPTGDTAIVRLLESIGEGDAAGVPQPEGALNRSGLEVIGIHVIVIDPADTVVLDVRVGDSTSFTSFRADSPCASAPSAARGEERAAPSDRTPPTPVAPQASTADLPPRSNEDRSDKPATAGPIPAVLPEVRSLSVMP